MDSIKKSMDAKLFAKPKHKYFFMNTLKPSPADLKVKKTEGPALGSVRN